MLQKLRKVNNRPTGENWPNPVTLIVIVQTSH
jgi:hypothetical protein